MQKHRINTVIGKDKKVIIELKQNFQLMEILSLKITQKDVYTSLCSDYGVVCGRISINNGLGVPNAKVSIFVPLSEDDEGDPVISALYPYKSVTDVNENGYRYNLLPERQQHSGHEATGTFPDQLDIISREEVLEVFEKYYKYTVKTNSAGDFMIWGVPLGEQFIHVDVDLSDIGCFSLRPNDFLTNGYGIDGFKSSYEFKSNSDFNALPQIKSFDKLIEVIPFWGVEDLCQIGLSRVDFDLSSLGVKIEPKAYLIGGVYTDIDDKYIRKNGNFKSKMGHKANLTTKVGKIELIRFSSLLDTYERPILEKLETTYDIDENGAFFVPLPMNMEYLSTNEFGESVYSNNSNKGVPTSSCYRIRVTLTDDGSGGKIRTGSYLVPNIRDYRDNPNSENYDEPNDGFKYLTGKSKSYAFSTTFDDYPEKAVDSLILNSIDGKYVPQDYFYRFTYNKVYTVSSFHGSYFNETLFVKDDYLGIKNLVPSDDDTITDVLTPPVNFGTKNYKFGNIWTEITLSFELTTQTALMLFYNLLVNILFYLSDVWLLRVLQIYLKKQAYRLQESTQQKYRLITYPGCEKCGEDSDEQLLSGGTIDSNAFCPVGSFIVIGSSSEANRILTNVTTPEYLSNPGSGPCTGANYIINDDDFFGRQNSDYCYTINEDETNVHSFDSDNYLTYDEPSSGYTFTDTNRFLISDDEVYTITIRDKTAQTSENGGKTLESETGCSEYDTVYDKDIETEIVEDEDGKRIIISNNVTDKKFLKTTYEGENYLVYTKTGLSEFANGIYTLIPGTYSASRLRKILLEYIRRKRIATLFCNGAVNYSFIDNWLSGSLYLYRFKAKHKQKEKHIKVKYCDDLLYFVERDDKFYYRSTKFTPDPNVLNTSAAYQYAGIWGEKLKTNKFRLGNPTTFVDLGSRDSFINEICTDLETECSVSRSIGPTSFQDIGELLGVYINYKMSISNGATTLDSFFNNGGFSDIGYKNVLAGDILQLISTNCETGIEEFDLSSSKYAGYSNEYIDPITNPEIFTGGTGVYGPFPITFSLTENGKSVRECINAHNYLDTSAQIVPFYYWDKKGTGFGPYDINTRDNQSWDYTQLGVVTGQSIQGSSYNYIWPYGGNDEFLLLPITYNFTGRITSGSTEIDLEFDIISLDDSHLDDRYNNEYPGFTYLYVTSVNSNADPATGILYIRTGETGWTSYPWNSAYTIIIRPTTDYYEHEEDNNRQFLSTPFLFYFGLRPGKTGIDKFMKYFGNNEAFPSIE